MWSVCSKILKTKKLGLLESFLTFEILQGGENLCPKKNLFLLMYSFQVVILTLSILIRVMDRIRPNRGYIDLYLSLYIYRFHIYMKYILWYGFHIYMKYMLWMDYIYIFFFSVANWRWNGRRLQLGNMKAVEEGWNMMKSGVNFILGSPFCVFSLVWGMGLWGRRTYCLGRHGTLLCHKGLFIAPML